MVRYASAIFLGAFLLFQVQPLLGSYILPWFGGAAGVWTACLLFFQAVLLAGYLYAHLLSRLSVRRQVLVHLGLLTASLALLPITPGPAWKPDAAGFPVLRILALLSVCVGGPFLLLSTTGPLFQSWFSRERPGASPYRLYALSNAASLLGLLTYPFLVQPRMDREMQTVAWSWAYGLFVAVSIVCGWRLLARGTGPADLSPAPGNAADTGPRFRLLWIALPACAVILLLGITNRVTTDMAAVPFLWVLPLVVYLLTFILTFDRDGWYSRRVFAPLLGAVLLANTFLVPLVVTPGWTAQFLIAAATLFVCGMVCHGELVRLKPSPRRLTAFYLSLAAGGAAGGVFVAVIAPAVFPGFWEVPLGLIACLLLFLTALHRDPASPLAGGRRPKAWQAIAVGVGILGPALLGEVLIALWNSDLEVRTFYSVLQVRVKDAGTPEGRKIMTHGNTVHGLQFLSPERRGWATAYYGPESGAALAVENHPRRGSGPLRIGVIGLGAGTLAAWVHAGDTVRFYEIDPEVETLARREFTFLESCPGSVEVVIGDGRISLEREATAGREPLDILAVDAFAEGSVPVHLLTRECLELYERSLAPDGILAVHVSNKYLRLGRVVRGAAEALGKRASQVVSRADPAHGRHPTHWVLVADPRHPVWDAPAVRNAVTPWSEGGAPVVWTDRFSSLLQILR
jgi:hypothetical protein